MLLYLVDYIFAVLTRYFLIAWLLFKHTWKI